MKHSELNNSNITEIVTINDYKDIKDQLKLIIGVHLIDYNWEYYIGYETESAFAAIIDKKDMDNLVIETLNGNQKDKEIQKMILKSLSKKNLPDDKFIILCVKNYVTDDIMSNSDTMYDVFILKNNILYLSDSFMLNDDNTIKEFPNSKSPLHLLIAKNPVVLDIDFDKRKIILTEQRRDFLISLLYISNNIETIPNILKTIFFLDLNVHLGKTINYSEYIDDVLYCFSMEEIKCVNNYKSLMYHLELMIGFDVGERKRSVRSSFVAITNKKNIEKLLKTEFDKFTKNSIYYNECIINEIVCSFNKKDLPSSNFIFLFINYINDNFDEEFYRYYDIYIIFDNKLYFCDRYINEIHDDNCINKMCYIQEDDPSEYAQVDVLACCTEKYTNLVRVKKEKINSTIRSKINFCEYTHTEKILKTDTFKHVFYPEYKSEKYKNTIIIDKLRSDFIGKIQEFIDKINNNKTGLTESYYFTDMKHIH